MPRILWFVVIGILFSIGGCSSTERRVDEAPLPASIDRVSDRAGVLTGPEIAHLTNLLARYESETSHQVCVLTVSTLAGNSIEAYSLGTANSLGLGLKGVDNGILIVVAPNDRKARIELGRGFGEYISDSRAQEIMDTQMIPAFRQQQYAVGIERGLSLLMSDGRAFVVGSRGN